MIHEPLLFAGISDFAGKIRGKAFPVADFDSRLRGGVGWTPTNVQISCFDVIGESPYGALGDLLMIPDRETEVRVDYEDDMPPEHWVLCHVKNLDGTPWECCTRHILERALERLKAVAGLELTVAFEHEFQLLHANRPLGDAYALAGVRDQSRFLATLMAALGQADLEPETVMKEYGEDQYEVTVAPAPALAAADASTTIKELTRATALRFDDCATFTPMLDPAGVGNGVHIHLSLRDDQGASATYDEAGVGGLSASAAAFTAGVLRDLDALVALTAPSVISYSRLTPHRWSAAFNNLGIRDREAAIRICPVSPLKQTPIEDQFNIEFRAADAAASPYLALAAIVHAGCNGIEDGLSPVPPTEEDLSLLDAESLAARGLHRLPTTLGDALDRLAENERLLRNFPIKFGDIYRAHKQAEIAHVDGMEEADMYAAYAAAY